MRLTFKNVMVNLIYYSVTLFLLPWTFLSIEYRLGFQQDSSPVLRIISIIVGVLGIVLQLWCIILFQVIGKGTPSPRFPTENLVIAGPYRWVRNPMNIGEILVFLALSCWFASMALVAYTVSMWLLFHLFIVFYEERKHVRKFGEDYIRYKSTVPRWIPNIKIKAT